ncbi:hypothetical protein J2S19_001573 [Metabacillus malikii]|uniref:Uncharacterized protein n=1 Tax=Metabacillus malikii TaxID=1504265 RepID=A0ABT9ZDI4_9BACI|nr:hypothetical protein [Metabacillus malikii]
MVVAPVGRGNGSRFLFKRSETPLWTNQLIRISVPAK